jgi:UDP-N-acetylglucosamine/UDP-N-acetylgalactosamine diphosphorylase
MEELKEKFTNAGQGHVFDDFDSLSTDQQESLLKEAKMLDLDLIEKLFQLFQSGHEPEDSKEFSPFPNILNLASESEDFKALLYKEGLSRIQQGQAAVLTFAGGQGTRLGVPYPKGMYDISLLSHKTLLQLFAERLIGLRKLSAGPAIPWVVMVNEETADLMKDFFESNFYFGLEPDQLFIFPQAMLPALEFNGKIILSEKGKISMSPNGNGGVYEGMLNSGAIDWLDSKGVKFLHICGIDNVLVKICDPVFIGYAFNEKAEVTTKVVKKVDYKESMGVLGMRGGKQGIIEYSELSEEMAKLEDEKGKLVYFGGNILNHVFSLSFLKRIVSNLDELRSKYHIAKKKVPIFKDGVKTTPTQPNGVKFELFYFDILSMAAKSAAIEVKRNEEFAPVKNATGVDSPESARKFVSDLHLSWVKNAGGIVVGGQNRPECVCEISPLVSYGGEGLECLNGKKINLPFYLFY